jgi:uncharacterized protein YhdP
MVVGLLRKFQFGDLTNASIHLPTPLNAFGSALKPSTMQVNATLYFTLAHMLDVEPEHVSKIMHLIRERQKVGEEKYGHTIDRTDLDEAQFRMHLLEELLDGAQYAVRAGMECQGLVAELLDITARLIEYMEENKEI